MENSKLITRAILNSLGVLIYVLIVASILNNANRIVEPMNKVIGPVVFLMLFVFSALLTGGLILGKPLLLYFEGFKKEGIKLLIYTGVSLFILLLLLIAVLFWIR